MSLLLKNDMSLGRRFELLRSGLTAASGGVLLHKKWLTQLNS